MSCEHLSHWAIVGEQISQWANVAWAIVLWSIGVWAIIFWANVVWNFDWDVSRVSKCPSGQLSDYGVGQGEQIVLFFPLGVGQIHLPAVKKPRPRRKTSRKNSWPALGSFIVGIPSSYKISRREIFTHYICAKVRNFLIVLIDNYFTSYQPG